MLTVRPTKLLARQLGITVPAEMPAVQCRVADWCAHSFTLGRERWLIFCNTASLYPVFASARGVKDGETLVRRVGGMVPQVLGENGYSDLAKRFESELHEVQWAPIPEGPEGVRLRILISVKSGEPKARRLWLRRWTSREHAA